LAFPKTQVVGIDVGIGPANQARDKIGVFGLWNGKREGGKSRYPEPPPPRPPPVIVVKLGKSKNDF